MKIALALSFGFVISSFISCNSNDHDYVDLGLPSGLLWATCNVGANAPQESGFYFAWGEISSKDTYEWSNYIHCTEKKLIKYCEDKKRGYDGFVDNKAVLEECDDAATANWGSGWRLPTPSEWKELISDENCSHQRTTENGVNGCKFTSLKNGNTLFLPAVGYREGNLLQEDEIGAYWSDSLSGAGDEYAYVFVAEKFGLVLDSKGERYLGIPVRAVRRP